MAITDQDKKISSMSEVTPSTDMFAPLVDLSQPNLSNRNVRASLAAILALTPAPSFASITGKPTTLAGYGITDGITAAAVAAGYQPLDADLTAIAALGTTAYGRGFLTLADAAASRAYIGAGTGNGTVTSVNLTQPAAGITVSGGPITGSGSITLALADDLAALEALSGTNTIYYRSGPSTWTAVTIGDNLSFSGGILSAAAPGTGTVTSFSSGDLSPLFTTSVANATTTPALSFSLNSQSANQVFAGPTGGGAAAPTFRSLVSADIPDLSGTYQPLDADLTAIAALTTTSYGRSFLTLADDAAARTYIGAGTGTIGGSSGATDNAIIRADGTGGSTIQTSAITITDSGELVFPGVASPAYTQGKLVYDTDNESLTFFNNDSSVALQVGQETWLRVRNDTGSTIANGSAVYISGTHASGLPNISLAQANSEATARVTGLATEAIANNAIGYITIIGLVRGLNTNSFTAGQALYLSATVAGGLTATIPAAPNFRYRVGTVARSNATQGTIVVELGVLRIGNGTANQIAGMNAAGTLQEYKTLNGTTNQVSVTHGANSITLATPQNIHTAATPQFAQIGIGGAAVSTHAIAVHSSTADVVMGNNGAQAFFPALAGRGLFIQRNGIAGAHLFSAAQSTTFVGVSTEGTLATPTATGANRGFQLVSAAYDGTNYFTGANQVFETTEVQSSTNRGHMVRWSTILTGSTSLAERARISGSGNLLVGTMSDTSLSGAGNIRASASLMTGDPSGSTAQPFKVGSYTVDAVTSQTGVVRIDIGGVVYKFLVGA